MRGSLQPAMMARVRARVVTWSEIDGSLLDRWSSLARHALEPNPFFEPAMLLAAARFLGDDSALLIVEDRSELEALVPVRRSSQYWRVPVTALVTWRDDYGLLGTPLVSPRSPVQAADALLSYVQGRGLAPWWAIQMLHADGPVAAALRVACEHRSIAYASFRDHDRAMVFKRPEATYLQGRMSGRHLKALRRQRRRLSEALGSEVSTRDAAAENDLTAAVDGYLETEMAGWKGLDGGAFAARPGHADFFRSICTSFAHEGRLQLLTLGTSTTAVAYQCNLVSQRTCFNFKICYNERFSAYSPGLLLDLDMLQAFQGDERLESVDSCAHPSNHAVNQLFPDRHEMTTLLLPLDRVVGPLVTRATPRLSAAHAHVGTARARLRRRLRRARDQ